jgi:hypothetical protein
MSLIRPADAQNASRRGRAARSVLTYYRAVFPCRDPILTQANEGQQNRRLQTIRGESMKRGLLLFANLLKLQIVPERQQSAIVRSAKPRDEKETTGFLSLVC